MRFVIHCAQTGRIHRHGTCPPEDVAIQPLAEGHALLTLPDDHHPIDDRRHRVDAGAIVAGALTGTKAQALAASRATKPVSKEPTA